MNRATGVVLVLVALVIGGIAGALIQNRLDRTSVAIPTTTLAPSTTTTSTTVPHASVTVLVVNGTKEANAAAHFTQILQAQGWKTATPGNSTSPASTTTVYFAPNQQSSATAVAAEIGASDSSVQPLTASVPVASTTGLDVVVVIGPDLAAQGFPASTTTST